MHLRTTLAISLIALLGVGLFFQTQNQSTPDLRKHDSLVSAIQAKDDLTVEMCVSMLRVFRTVFGDMQSGSSYQESLDIASSDFEKGMIKSVYSKKMRSEIRSLGYAEAEIESASDFLDACLSPPYS